MKRKTWVTLFLAVALVMLSISVASAASATPDAIITVPSSVHFSDTYDANSTEYTLVQKYNVSAYVTKYTVKTEMGGATLTTTYTEYFKTPAKNGHGDYYLDITNALGLANSGTATIVYSSNGAYQGYQLYRGNFALEQIPLTVQVIKGDAFSVIDGLTAAEISNALSKMSGPSGSYYGGTIYPVDPNAHPASAGGWRDSPSGRWYELENGTYVRNQWKKIDGKWYYFDTKGYLATNRWVGDYYVLANGEMAVDTWIDGKYYVNSNGIWVKEARATSGWQKDSNGWWYKNADGSYPKSTWRWIDDNGDGLSECYYFNAQGYVVTNSSIDGSTVNGSGAWTVNGVVQHKSK